MLSEVLSGEVEGLAIEFIENIEASDVDYHLALRKLYKVLDMVFKDEAVIAKARLQIGDGLDKYGCKAYIKSNSGYDFSDVDHVELTHIEKAMKVLAGRHKAIISMLKEIPEGEVISTTVNGYPTLVENELEKPALINIRGPKIIEKPTSPVFAFPTKK